MHRAGLALLTALATALLLPAAATAATPLRQSIEVDETFLGDRLAALCGVPVEIHLEGTLTATYFYDASGTQVLREIDTAPGFKFTVSSPVELGGTGRSLTSPSPAVAHVDYPEGTSVGSPAIITFTGLTGAVPGVAGAGRWEVSAIRRFASEACPQACEGARRAGGASVAKRRISSPREWMSSLR